MGGGYYDSVSRGTRTTTYKSASSDQIFTQARERRIHQSMDPAKALLREARDSKNHPNSVPIVLALDLTGSMLHVPLFMVREGLPKIMGDIIQRGVLDPQILFLGIGDIECDEAPLQVGQFESGDEELDMWLTRVWLEGGGGGNGGESYSLAWYFTTFHTVTDAWEKRKQKGFLFTIGDEPCLRNLDANQLGHLMGVSSQASFTDRELVAKVQEKYNVYHLHVMEGSAGKRSLPYWKQLLGDNCIVIDDFHNIADQVIKIVTSNVNQNVTTTVKKEEKIPEVIKQEEIIL